MTDWQREVQKQRHKVAAALLHKALRKKRRQQIKPKKHKGAAPAKPPVYVPSHYDKVMALTKKRLRLTHFLTLHDRSAELLTDPSPWCDDAP